MSGMRLVLIAVVALGIGMLIGNAVVMRDKADPDQVAAQERCEQDVLKRLAAPDTAELVEVKVTTAQLDPETTDLSALGRDGLKGVDRAKITVRAVSGVVKAPNAFGQMLNDPFTCRAYFVDDTLTDTLVVFEHDH
ncbi:MAG: hypothetical protein KIH64_001600 [Mycobacterium sp.]|nr:hypothetical protein [Mycobacterium sp.]